MFKYKIKKLLFSNWLLCSLFTLLIITAMLWKFYPMEFLEYKAYDFLAGLRRPQGVPPIVIVEIDERSLQEIGSWPWPRSVFAEALNRIATFKPRVTGLHLLFSGPELNPAASEVRALRDALMSEPLLKRGKAGTRVDRLLAEVEAKLDYDADLTEAVNYTVNAVLPILFRPQAADPQGAAGGLPGWLVRHSLESPAIAPHKAIKAGIGERLMPDLSSDTVVFGAVLPTYEDLARRAGALGHINCLVDIDNTVRQAPLLIGYAGRMFPSFALQAAAKYLKIDLQSVRPGDSGLTLDSTEVPTDGQYRMLIDYRGRRNGFQRVSFADVYLDKVPGDLFADKIVLLAQTVPWLSPRYRTSVGSEAALVDIAASTIENIIEHRHLSRPIWASVLEILVVVYFGLFLVFVIPRVKPRDGALILSIFLVTWLCFTVVLFMAFGYWLKVSAPVLLTVIGFSIAGFHRFASEKQQESIELNKMLGLSFQSKGMLDMAYEKFRRCPVDNASVRELLYNLGQDYERKRMFNKAIAVYGHLSKAGRYRDILQRIEALKNIGESPAVNTPKSNGSIILDEATTRPTLGRYEIIAELGQGAMGTVYLGLDPKINREVAIKTLSYGNVNEEKLDEIKGRFLREAEAAGKLSHPNIVTIFDVGEEHDMAYIAMELLKGKVLTEFCSKENALSVQKVLEVVAAVAKALDYAHANGVVHRDIKPDNIILLEGGQVKVADFGIARVTSASNTQTGVIMGTPNYMSPEQVEGLHVDGRSDLFSLGVVMYELLACARPFHGDNVAHLMYKIAAADYTPLDKTAPKTPPCCLWIVKKLLTKDPAKRIPSAAKLVHKIQQCQSALA